MNICSALQTLAEHKGEVNETGGEQIYGPQFHLVDNCISVCLHQPPELYSHSKMPGVTKTLSDVFLREWRGNLEIPHLTRHGDTPLTDAFDNGRGQLKPELANSRG